MTPAEAIALALLADISDIPPGGLKPEHDLVHDLRIDGDDYAMTFVWKLQRRLEFRAPRKEWEVRTVEEVLSVVRRHAPPQPAE